jgi:hypothetical protein
MDKSHKTLVEMFNHLVVNIPEVVPLFRAVLQQHDEFVGFGAWRERGYSAPSPEEVKRACLLRNGINGGVWVETGTYLGSTTAFLAQHASIVFSIEPEPALFERASVVLEKFENVRLINGVSEQVFPSLLPTLRGDVSFWLDGHYSEGITFKGATDTPIVEELNWIAECLPSLGRVSVMIDDIRCFEPSHEAFMDYPNRDFLVDWCRVNRCDWHIEHDIFVARKK